MFRESLLPDTVSQVISSVPSVTFAFCHSFVTITVLPQHTNEWPLGLAIHLLTGRAAVCGGGCDGLKAAYTANTMGLGTLL